MGVAENLFCNLSENRWAKIALKWDPRIHYDRPKPSARRRPARPHLRWSDELEKFIYDATTPGMSWSQVSTNKNFWRTYEDQFMSHD